MIQIFKDGKAPVGINFRIEPRDFMRNSIFLPLETINALNLAASTLKDMSDGRYEIVLTRGYVKWNRWRVFRGAIAKAIFSSLDWQNRSDARLLFGSNGHDDGFSVDVLLYDNGLHKTIKFLPWNNVIMRRTTAINILEANRHLINMLDASMVSGGFERHTDPREMLQMHFRLLKTP